jgi:hypothetical protein
VDPVTGGKFIEQLRFSQKNSAPWRYFRHLNPLTKFLTWKS